MNQKDGANPKASRKLEELIDAYFDRELPPEEEASLAHLLQRDAGAAMLFGESEAAIDALRLPVNSPDLSGRILTEVGRRRGWLGARLQRFVAVGRVAVAACLLLALAVTLTAKRFSPDAAVFPQSPTPIADVARCAADDTSCSVDDFLAALDQVGEVARLNEVRNALPSVTNGANHAGLFSMVSNRQERVEWRGRTFSPEVRPELIELTIAIARDGSFKQLTTQQQVGAIVYITRSAPAAPTNEDSEATVGGW